jgi:PIN domain nuclease of toxin-antitoxin system
VRLLLDTHILLWWLKDPEKIAAEARAAIRDPRNTVYYSAASIWEMAIKSSLGKLPRLKRTEVESALEADAILALPISLSHVWRVPSLPRHHTDPFDRLLVAQALEDSLILVTRDEKLAPYPVKQMNG